MVEVVDRMFKSVTIDLDEHRYFRCIFQECELVYRGGDIHFDGCGFLSCTFTFDGAAGRTLSLLKGLAQTPGCEGAIEALLGLSPVAKPQRPTMQ